MSSALSHGHTRNCTKRLPVSQAPLEDSMQARSCYAISRIPKLSVLQLLLPRINGSGCSYAVVGWRVVPKDPDFEELHGYKGFRV